MAEPLEPLECLFEVGALPHASIPAELARLHDGDLGLAETCLYANFVATLDGVVSIPTMRGSNVFIAGGNDADRFLMGLLRAFADAVLIGAGVLRASPRGTWRAEGIYPPLASEYAELRRQLGLATVPEVAVLTGSGSIDRDHPLLESAALVLTSEGVGAQLRSALPSATTVVALSGDARIDPHLVVGALRDRGHRRILCEAGPHTFGALVGSGVVDELFLTTSPLLVGDGGSGSRFALVEGADLTPTGVRGRLLSVRRQGSHLFHRYALERGTP